MKFIFIGLLSFLLKEKSIANKLLNSDLFVTSDTITEIRLPIYRIDSCVFDVLKPIVTNDRKCSYFRDGYTAYSFSVSKIDGGFLIGIRPVRLDNSKPGNYFGIFEFRQRKFLCWGERPIEFFHTITSDSTTLQFHKNEEINFIDFYLGGDVPSAKKLVDCKHKIFYFIITTNCY